MKNPNLISDWLATLGLYGWRLLVLFLKESWQNQSKQIWSKSPTLCPHVPSHQVQGTTIAMQIFGGAGWSAKAYDVLCLNGSPLYLGKVCLANSSWLSNLSSAWGLDPLWKGCPFQHRLASHKCAKQKPLNVTSHNQIHRHRPVSLLLRDLDPHQLKGPSSALTCRNDVFPRNGNAPTPTLHKEMPPCFSLRWWTAPAKYAWWL